MIFMDKYSTTELIDFQTMLMKFQMYADDYFTKLALMSQSPTIVLWISIVIFKGWFGKGLIFSISGLKESFIEFSLKKGICFK